MSGEKLLALIPASFWWFPYPVLVLCYPLIALVIAFFVARRWSGIRQKLIVGVLTLAILLVTPLADEITGRLYFSYLCQVDGGLKVYRQVELPREYWNEDGTPTFISSDGELDEGRLGNRYAFELKGGEYFRFGITSHKATITDLKVKDVLAEHTRFLYRHGWLMHSFPGHVGAISCPRYDDVPSLLADHVFTLKPSVQP